VQVSFTATVGFVLIRCVPHADELLASRPDEFITSDDPNFPQEHPFRLMYLLLVE
jgi:hypothetical protein